MKKFDYKKKRQELEIIINKLQESGAEDIDESIELYKKARSIIIDIEDYLVHAENEIEKIK